MIGDGGFPLSKKIPLVGGARKLTLAAAGDGPDLGSQGRLSSRFGAGRDTQATACAYLVAGRQLQSPLRLLQSVATELRSTEARHLSFYIDVTMHRISMLAHGK